MEKMNLPTEISYMSYKLSTMGRTTAVFIRGARNCSKLYGSSTMC